MSRKDASARPEINDIEAMSDVECITCRSAKNTPSEVTNDSISDFVPESDREGWNSIDESTAAKFINDADLVEGDSSMNALTSQTTVEGRPSMPHPGTDASIDRVSEAPWRKQQWTTAHRAELELHFCQLIDYAIHNSWERTELVQKDKDKQMLLYIEDFPLTVWTIGLYRATAAYEQLLERSRWRAMGVRIYGTQRISAWIPGNTTSYGQAHGAPPIRRLPSSLPGWYPLSQRDERKGGVVMQMSLPQKELGQSQARTTQHTQPIRTDAFEPHRENERPDHKQSILHTRRASYETHPDVPSVGGVTTPHAKKVYREVSRPKSGQDSTIKIPPFPKASKPSERTALNRTGRRAHRQPAEAEEFPWHRQGIDFEKAKMEATWDDSGYSKVILQGMRATRARNDPIIEALDEAALDKLRQDKVAKKMGLPKPGAVGLAGKTAQPRQSRKVAGKADGPIGDPHHMGTFMFATDLDRERARGLGKSSPDEIFSGVESGTIKWEACGDIKICWYPGNKGTPENLEQVVFTIADTLRTRKQLLERPVLTSQAANRLIDFTPDWLWRGMLLRVASEAGLGNKDIRTRFCRNGSFCDKATMTKRISAALGQKQPTNSARKVKALAKENGFVMEKGDDLGGTVKAYQPGEAEWYEDNQQSFNEYIRFFGKRATQRSYLKVRKRAGSVDDASSIKGEAGSSSSVTSKRLKLARDSTDSLDELIDEDDMKTSSEDEELDAVSIQDSNDLTESD